MVETLHENESLWNVDKIKSLLNNFKKNISESLSKPKEWSDEYNRLNDLLWDKIQEWEKVDDYIKYWTIKKIKTAKKLISEWIIKKENISKNWAYMDKWDDKKIWTAKKLVKLWMEISPYNYEYMEYRTEKEIENLKLFKEKNGNSLEYIDMHPIFGNETLLEIWAMDYPMFKKGIPTDILNNNSSKNKV